MHPGGLEVQEARWCERLASLGLLFGIPGWGVAAGFQANSGQSKVDIRGYLVDTVRECPAPGGRRCEHAYGQVWCEEACRCRVGATCHACLPFPDTGKGACVRLLMPEPTHALRAGCFSVPKCTATHFEVEPHNR